MEEVVVEVKACEKVLDSSSTVVVDEKGVSAAAGTPAGILQLFRFSTSYDRFLISSACICAAGHGVIMPLFSLLFGDVINGLNTSGSIMSIVPTLCLKIMGLALAGGACAFLQATLANVAAVRQVRALRSAYVASLLRQDMAWSDAHSPGEVAARLTEDTVALEDGIGQKFSMIFQSVTTFGAGIILAFTLSWKMSLVLLGFLPFLGAVMAMITQLILGTDKKSGDAYAEAGEIATEALANIRTVAAYGGEATLAQRYDAALGSAEKEGVKKATLTGLTFGTFLMTLFTVYGVSLLWGAQLVLWSREANNLCTFNPATPGCFTGGTVMQVLFALIMGAGALGQLAPSVTALTSARSAGGRIFEVLDRVPVIDTSATPPGPPAPFAVPTLEGGRRGRIEFRDVSFAYPARPSVWVLKNFSLIVEPGQNLALVGQSGCGKSTLIALIQRWYDVSEGAVLVDGCDVRQWPVQTLRAAQALVSQESLLLAGSVARNLELGTIGGAASTPSSSDLEAAARAANAHEFIAALPAGYATPLSNTSLSGGQRQRICIARALLRADAPILLLDEATSALDTRSERVVQEALDALVSSQGGKRTSLTIAHRLSTIDKADRVVVMSQGKIVESGSPAELMGRAEGIFKAMREAQEAHHAGHAAAGAQGGGSDSDKEAAVESTEATAGAAAAAATATATASASASAAGPYTSSSYVAALAPPPPASSSSSRVTGGGGTPKPAVEKPKTPKEEAEAVPLLGDESEPAFPRVSWYRVASYNAPELLYGVLGVLSCAVTGATMPAFALILSRFITIYFDPDGVALWRNAIFYMGMFLLIGGANFVFCVVQQYSFGLLGERLVRRIRSAAFSNILRFEISWHDAHPPGAVTSLLGTYAYLLRAATGPTLALNIQNLIGLVAGLIIAFTASWQITLVVLCVAPLIALGGTLALKYMTRSMDESIKAFEVSGAVATEALSAPRTVAAYGLQDASAAAYTAALAAPTASNLAGAWVSGTGMGIMALMMVGTYAILFGVGAVFMSQGILNFQNLLTAMFGVMFAAMGMGNSGGMQADAAKIASATSTLLGLMDRKPRIPVVSPAEAAAAAASSGASPPVGCALSLKGVTLQYKGRAGVPPALNALDLDIPAGAFVALVGASGCGKSSVVSLLLRFYEPSSGAVTLNGVDIRSLTLEELRGKMAWVQQEPSLFNSSIGYNIGFPAYPPPLAAGGGLAAATKEQVKSIQDAARASGAHDFVAELPDAYDTLCGTRGSQLSGGQKQRLCIARALLRSAPVLLLDEATSALDSASEALVQSSIDALLEAKRAEGAGATVLVIAHRLSTVQSADFVVVMEGGRVVESGKYAELAGKDGGLFKSMLALQNLI